MKYLILGAGPAGLTLSNRLKQSGEDSFLILEKEAEAGGLCRSEMVDGAPLDIGGGHFLDVKRKAVNDFLFQFMPKEEWELFERDSRICLNNYEIGHPIEANIWQLNIDDQIEYLKEIAKAGCNTGTDMPEKFIDWIYWKLGKRIAEDYMIPYNKKMFGEELNQLGIYWLEKLPSVSFEETLRSCLERKAYGTQPGHSQFYYPKKYGYGELWRRMADMIQDHIIYGECIQKLDFGKREVVTEKGNTYSAEYIITTIPWGGLKCVTGSDRNLMPLIKKLKYSSIEVEYCPEHLNTAAHWVYYPDLELPYHRILVRHNFCQGSCGYWTETNGARVTMKKVQNMQNITFRYFNEYAYPLNTVDKPNTMRELLNMGKQYNVYGLGRWGEHMHYNSDVTVELALNFAEKLKSL